MRAALRLLLRLSGAAAGRYKDCDRSGRGVDGAPHDSPPWMATSGHVSWPNIHQSLAPSHKGAGVQELATIRGYQQAAIANINAVPRKIKYDTTEYLVLSSLAGFIDLHLPLPPCPKVSEQPSQLAPSPK